MTRPKLRLKVYPDIEQVTVYVPQSEANHPVSIISCPKSTSDLVLVAYRYPMMCCAAARCIAWIAVELTQMYGICDIRMSGSCGIHYGFHHGDVMVCSI